MHNTGILAAFLLYLFSLSICCLNAQPLAKQQQQQLASYSSSIKTSIPASYLKRYQNMNEFERYYTNIVNLAMDEVVRDLIETAADTYYTIHELQFVGKDYCNLIYTDITHSLEYQMNHKVRYRLLAAIRPLIDIYYDQNKKVKSIIELNHFIGQQLGLILNAHHLSDQIIRQISDSKSTNNILQRLWKLVTNRKYAEARQHELNESIALQAWLQSWLTDIEFIVTEDFDSNLYTLSQNVVVV
ncbi:hypothetical protein BDF20DRAFT_165404 [Mycotypha africana]|uniref:uncharacterized protein n=1 Tax=Mycotypha africana TaxID=64632 RepID=UPI002300315C|nr:uncharacterized protein BDF20DRAFT_165404 [Mycotypha africana]KAI8968178.1 hypothetical protein BDF20DRAFT_165404 [Mycotypha africana]